MTINDQKTKILRLTMHHNAAVDDGSDPIPGPRCRCGTPLYCIDKVLCPRQSKDPLKRG